MAKKRWIGGVWLLVKLGLWAGLFGLMAGAGSLCYFEFAPPERTCLSCHELRAPYDRWAASAHREVDCKRCHGGTFLSGLHGLRENFQRAVAHFRDVRHENMHLSEEQVARIVNECKRCHPREYVEWHRSGHGVTYTEIFLNQKHNATEQIAEDCLRCHGMFFEGSVRSVVAPLDTKGPWKLKNLELADRPVIPCLACHKIHVPQHPTTKDAPTNVLSLPDHPTKLHSVPVGAAERAAVSSLPSLLAEEGLGVRGNRGADRSSKVIAPERRETMALYMRREKASMTADDLPIPVVYDHDKAVLVSPDPRQRLCVQCHATNAFQRSGTGDDRTPTGVHEGLSCAACHAPHSNDVRASCATCHPRFSHCGLDVTTMDTTFRSRASSHNIHRVHCADCHIKGVPGKKSTDKAPNKTP